MTTVIIGMLVALAIAAGVVALVAIPARRQGRDVLSPQGEQILQAARERTVEAVDAAREKVGDLKPTVARGDGATLSPAGTHRAMSDGEDSSIDVRAGSTQTSSPQS